MSPSTYRTDTHSTDTLGSPNGVITDALHSDTTTWESTLNPAGRMLITALDRAVGMQTSLISNYITRLRRKHPEESPAQLQRRVDKHFLRLATASGAGVGATAAVPGIGFLFATAAVGAESVVFLDAAAFYTMASAHLRGADISDPERRRALILVALLGAKGSAIVDTFLGDITVPGQDTARPTMQVLNRFSVPTLSSMNARLLRTAVRRLSSRLTRGWLGKIMPLGIGAIAGTIANRRLARYLINNTGLSLGTPPAYFLMALAELPAVPADQAKAIDAFDEDALAHISDSDLDSELDTELDTELDAELNEVREEKQDSPRWKLWNRGA